MHIAILTFDGFNELDSLIALNILNRVKRPGWRVSIASPSSHVRSMNGVVVEAQASLEEARDAQAVLVGSGVRTRDVAANTGLMSRLAFDPQHQLRRARDGEHRTVSCRCRRPAAPINRELSRLKPVRSSGPVSDSCASMCHDDHDKQALPTWQLAWAARSREAVVGHIRPVTINAVSPPPYPFSRDKPSPHTQAFWTSVGGGKSNCAASAIP